MVPPEHYFTSSPGGEPVFRQIGVRLAGRDVTVTTANAVFSPDHVDTGTQVLLGSVPAPPPGGEAAAREMAFAQWRTNVFDSETAAELATPAAFEAHAARVRPQDMDQAVRISADLGRHAAWLAEDLELGADRVFVHNVGTNQREALEAFGAQVLPRLA